MMRVLGSGAITLSLAGCLTPYQSLSTSSGTLTSSAATSSSSSSSSTTTTTTSYNFTQMTSFTATAGQVAVASDGSAWAVSSPGNQLYQFDTSTQTWDSTAVPGISVTQVAVAPASVNAIWAIDSTTAIYSISPSQAVSTIVGSLSQIAEGNDGSVFGVNSSGDAYFYDPYSSAFVQMPGSGFSSVAVGNSSYVYATTTSAFDGEEAFQFGICAGLGGSGTSTGSCTTTSNWQDTGVKLSQISVGIDGTVWGVDSSQYVYYYNTASTTPGWTQLQNAPALTQVAVGSASVVWGVNSGSGQLFVLNPSTLEFEYVSPANLSYDVNLTSVSVGVSSSSSTAVPVVMGISSAKAIYQITLN